VTGGEEGSTQLSFTPAPLPGPPLAAQYSFDIGTAGSSTLVLATILPIIWSRLPPGAAPVEVSITGGTHNPHAPSFDFLASTLLPLLRQAGLPPLALACPRLGFYPQGGGRLTCTIPALPAAPPPRCALLAGGPVTSVTAALLATPAFPAKAAQAHTQALTAAALCLPASQVEQRRAEASGPAACAMAFVRRSAAGAEGSAAPLPVVEVCVVYSERKGQSSAQLAGELAAEVAQLQATSAPISHRAADQLLLPLALFTQGGSFRCQASQDLHFATNAGVIEAFLGQGIITTSAAEPEAGGEGEGAASAAAAQGGGALHAGVLVNIQPRAYYAPHAVAGASASASAPVPASAATAEQGGEEREEGGSSPKKARVSDLTEGQ
jgi:RNA 3'-terminal phosphate cyclase (ATP)